jgi:protein-tyrosine phosphatase
MSARVREEGKGQKIGVLFVCLGNICRSPTAEITFAAEVARRGLSDRFAVDSAGTGDWHAGELAHDDTRACAKRHGLSITHRARQIVPDDLDKFDYVLTMDKSNHQNVLRLATTPAQRRKVQMYRQWDPEGGGKDAEVPDPWYTGKFELVFEMCTRTSAALLDDILAKPASGL